MSNSSEITFKVASSSDYDQVLEFIRSHYYPEEPITIGNEPREQSVEDEEFSMSSLDEGTTIMAVDGDNEMVGVCISGAIQPNDAEKMIEDSKRVKSKKWSEILLLLAYLEHKANVCERFNVPKSLHMHVMGVHPKVRGQSIGVKLMGRCMANGKQLGFKLASTDCTSIFSIKIAERLGMECIETLAFDEYRDKTDGRQIFKPTQPHTHIKTFIQRLEDYVFEF